MKKKALIAAVMLIILSFADGYAIAADNSENAYKPTEETVFDSSFTVHVRTVDVEITEMNTYIKPGEAFTITYKVKSLLTVPQEVVYYFDSSVPLSGHVDIAHNDHAEDYAWGTKVLLDGSGEHTLRITLSPPPNFPGPNESSYFNPRFRVVRQLQTGKAL